MQTINSSSSGTLVNSIGFEWMLVGIAILCFCYAPLMLLLRAPPTKEEKKVGAVGGVDNPVGVTDGDVVLPVSFIVANKETTITKL